MLIPASCLGKMAGPLYGGLTQSFIVGYSGKGITSTKAVAKAEPEGADHTTP